MKLDRSRLKEPEIRAEKQSKMVYWSRGKAVFLLLFYFLLAAMADCVDRRLIVCRE